MVLFAWLMFRDQQQPVHEDAARARLAFDEPDFTACRWLIDERGRAALAEGEGGEFALVFRLGADLVTRRFPAQGVKVAIYPGALVIRPGGAGGGIVHLLSEEAEEWARKLAKPA